MESAYIEKLHMRNFRQFKLLDVEFGRKFNFIAGPNGCGKTSLLTGISHCLSNGTFNYSRFNDDSEFWIDVTVNDEKKRIGMGKGSIHNKGYRQQSVKSWTKPNAEEGRQAFSINEIGSLGFCPLFIGAQRNIRYQHIGGTQREESMEQQVAQYTSSGAQSLYGEKTSNIKQWFVNRYFMIDKEWAVEEKLNWENMIDSLKILGPFNSNFSYISTGRDLEPIFSIYGEQCYLEELSAGFQAVLSIVANIFEWIEGTRKSGSRNAKEATGTVLIDELDLHLHPEWQFTLRDGLSAIFPNIQFIVTTHSPHLLASAKENEVIVMTRNYEENEYNLKPNEKRFSGWNTDQILSEIMGVESLDNKDYEILIAKAFDQVESRSLQGLKSAIQNLEELCHPSDSILTVLKAKYASMVAGSND